eukprot:TRINITY_DN5530_c1_g1_i1.p1 TRINITY_DN5530_c1_g1~~TRINITY_DN5530_c1_g1_i1.p1  ORF type:complete len:480 (-),score=85.16 TRINITY_DN5530_c1_g1_i1:35-1474(-)
MHQPLSDAAPGQHESTAQKESERLVGARLVDSVSAAASAGHLSDQNFEQAGDGVVWVCAAPSTINDTPDPLEPYVAAELDGTPLISRGDEATRCLLCGRLFSGGKAFSELAIHQGKPCQPPEVPDSPHPVRITFARWRQPHVCGVLAAGGLVLEGCGEDSCDVASNQNPCSFVVDVSILQRTLRQLAFAEASAYNLERWYEALQEHTAATTTVPLEEADLTMMQKLHAAWHASHGHSVDDVTLRTHAAFEQRLQEAGWGDTKHAGSRRFVKTSMRSPKDGVRVEHAPHTPPHERLQREVEACAVDSGAAALELLIASKRVMSDIGHFRRYRAQGASNEFNVVLRTWDDAVAGTVEWRCFVADGRLTAISQYHCYTALPEIVHASAEELRATRDRLVAFHRRVHGAVEESVRVPSYVLDVATPVSGDQMTPVRLVEVNPLHTSGGALFTWRHDTDVLLRGSTDGAVEMRLLRSTSVVASR